MPAKGDDSEVLVRRAQRGDSAAFEALFRAHYGHVLGCCRTYCRSDADAADLAQEVFLRVHGRLASLRDASAFGAWVRTIARNMARDAAARRARQAELQARPPEQAAPARSEQRLLNREARHMVGEILGALPAGRQREAARLFYLEDLEVREVARRLDTSVTNVTTAVSRARGWLRRHLLLRLTELRGYRT